MNSREDGSTTTDVDLFAQYEDQRVAERTIEVLGGTHTEDETLIMRFQNTLSKLMKMLVGQDERIAKLEKQVQSLATQFSNLQQFIKYDSALLVGPEPVEPKLEDYTKDCQKCGGRGIVSVAVKVEGRPDRYAAERCECYQKYQEAHEKWVVEHSHWLNSRATAARREARNQRDLERQGGSNGASS